MKNIYGLIGYPVKHSLSAFMQNAAFNELGIKAEYRLFEIEPKDLRSFLLEDSEVKDTTGKTFRSRDIIGFNITIPHKVTAKEILEKEFPKKENKFIQIDELDVKVVGAINTVKRGPDKLEYWNTDASGFLRSLKDDLKFEPKGKSVFLIGCGGAGIAIAAALSWKNTGAKEIFIYDISEKSIGIAKEHFSKFSDLSSKISFVKGIKLPETIRNCQLLVNASGLGMKDGDESPVDKQLLHSGLSVYDIIYNRQTQLLKDANDLSHSNGLGMLLYQGVDAFELWFATKAPVEVMRKALYAAA
jgi:shikimate dehydrogenase